MVDAIISTVLGDLTSMVLSSIKEEVKLVSGVNDEIKKLVSNFKSIQAVLDDAEEQQVKEASVKNWLSDLKAVSYDMDDVLDEWKTWIQTSQLQNQYCPSNQNHLKDKVLSFFRCICFTTSDIGLRHVVGGKIREIQQRLNDIATDKVRYQLNSSEKTEKHIERHVTTSFIDTQKVKGRDEEKDRVKSMILNAKSKLHIISLVGMGGIGKTTLAKLIYNDIEIQSHFEKKMWVCVSEPFDEMRIAKAILESLCVSSSTRDFKELENVLKEISATLNKKRFLLVLDDVWNENHSKWEELEQFFKCGLPGSTILVTTRNERVAKIIGCNPESIHKMGFLTSEECWSIISQITLIQGDRQNLESIGRRIADKCKGLPLVATIVGGLLSFKKSEKEWLRILERNEWEGDDALDSLKFSYYDLPLPLKQCFLYCAIFPKDYKIEKRKLIAMWMAQGYLRGKTEEEDLDMVGEIYFENLTARSLLQISSNNDRTCMLHDMVSDLAQTLCKNECLIIEVLNDTELNINSLHADTNVRHLTLLIEKDVQRCSIYGLNKLRSLSVKSLSTVNVVKDILDHLTCLRTLSLCGCDIKEVPSSISKLVHLRWLDLSCNANLDKLPETLCNCYNLQTLILEECENLIELPQGIGELVNLIYLDIRFCSKLKMLPKGIGNLWRLKELTDFYIHLHEDESSSIVELGKLNNLRGTLNIWGLGKVSKKEEARTAQLKEKKDITQLNLYYGAYHRKENEEELLEALEPPLDLEDLYMENYKGKTLFSSWMMKLNLLRVLRINICENCEELPPLGKLPCLEVLYLSKMRVKKLGVEFMGIEKEEPTSLVSFPKLKMVVFYGFIEWEDWDDIDEWLMERITVMPRLQVLQLTKCLILKTLPRHLLSPVIPRLQRLDIDECHVLRQEI